MPTDPSERRPGAWRRLLADVVAALRLAPKGFSVQSARARTLCAGWLASAERRRLSFVARRGEEVLEVRRLSRVVLIWPVTGAVLAAVAIVAADQVLWLSLILALLYGIGAARRRRVPKRREGEAPSALTRRWQQRRRAVGVATSLMLMVGAVVLHDWSPLALRAGALASLAVMVLVRCVGWWLDMFVLSSTALWRFQGLLDFRLSSLEYSKIQAGPNATSGLATWLPIGTIEMDSAAQTGDLPMQRIGPIWGAEDLAVRIFGQRKRSGQRVRIIHPDPPPPGPDRRPDSGTLW